MLLLRDLVTAAALLWLTLSDDWPAIGVSAALVVSHAFTMCGRSTAFRSRKTAPTR